MMDADPPLPPSRSSDHVDTSTSTSTSVALSPLTSYKLYLCTPTQLLSLRLPALKPTFARTALKSDAKSKAAQSAAQLQNQAGASLPRTLRIRDCRGHGSPQRAIQRIALGHLNNHRLVSGYVSLQSVGRCWKEAPCVKLERAVECRIFTSLPPTAGSCEARWDHRSCSFDKRCKPGGDYARKS